MSQFQTLQFSQSEMSKWDFPFPQRNEEAGSRDSNTTVSLKLPVLQVEPVPRLTIILASAILLYETIIFKRMQFWHFHSSLSQVKEGARSSVLSVIAEESAAIVKTLQLAKKKLT